MMLRRTKYDIIADVLKAISKNFIGLRITELCRLANLPVDRGVRITEFLKDKGLIYEEPLGSVRIFKISDLGYTYLSLYESLTSLVK